MRQRERERYDGEREKMRKRESERDKRLDTVSRPQLQFDVHTPLLAVLVTSVSHNGRKSTVR